MPVCGGGYWRLVSGMVSLQSRHVFIFWYETFIYESLWFWYALQSGQRAAGEQVPACGSPLLPRTPVSSLSRAVEQLCKTLWSKSTKCSVHASKSTEHGTVFQRDWKWMMSICRRTFLLFSFSHEMSPLLGSLPYLWQRTHLGPSWMFFERSYCEPTSAVACSLCSQPAVSLWNITCWDGSFFVVFLNLYTVWTYTMSLIGGDTVWIIS